MQGCGHVLRPLVIKDHRQLLIKNCHHSLPSFPLREMLEKQKSDQVSHLSKPFQQPDLASSGT